MARPRVLLSSLGTFEPTPYEYSLSNCTYTASFSPLALCQFLSENAIDEVCILLTAEAKKHQEAFEKEAHELGIYGLTFKSIPDGQNQTEVDAILNVIADAINDDCDLILDMTQGMRHFPFLFYAAALHLQSLRNVRVVGAYYAMKRGPGFSFVDLTDLLELPRWRRAVYDFVETGRALLLSKEMKAEAGRLAAAKKPLKECGALANCLQQFHAHFDSGMALEVGKDLSRISKILNAEEERIFAGVPFGGDLADKLELAISKHQFPHDFEKKSDIVLTKAELARQVRLIDTYLAGGLYSPAIRLMREWVVSSVMFHTGNTSGWLEYGKPHETPPGRGYAEFLLGRLIGSAHTTSEGDSLASLKSFYAKLRKVRNQIAHCSISNDDHTGAGWFDKYRVGREGVVEGIRESWEFWKTQNDWPNLKFGGGNGRVLLAAVGMSPGVLFTSLLKQQPETLVAIVSAESRELLQEILSRYEQETGNRPDVLPRELSSQVVEGVSQWRNQVHKDGLVKEKLREADTVEACMTGGSSLMGLAVSDLAHEARSMGRPSRRFVIVGEDGRVDLPKDPWKIGKILWLDPERSS